MTAEENVADLCRICAKLSYQTENLFETLHNDMVLSEMLKFCLKRPILKEESLPRNICPNCKGNLISTYNFHNLCESSEKYLLTTYSLQEVNDDRIFPPYNNTLGESHSNDVITILIKCEDDDDDYYGHKDDSALNSEVICVDERDESGIIASENPNFDVHSMGETKYQSLVIQTIEQKIYECFECKTQFDELRELRNHMHDHDSSRKPFECITCNMRFVHLNSWFRHRSRHTKNIHSCEYCESEFNTLTALKRHIQAMHKERLNAYRCEQCSEEFSLKFLLIWHYEWHKKAKQFDCSTCGAVFFSERKLKAHIREKHASMFRIGCWKMFTIMFLIAIL